MPPPLDLTGRRFGHLTVIRRNGLIFWGREQACWLCRCDCGVEISAPQNRLPHRDSIPQSHIIDACEDCRSHPCDICAAPIPASSASKTCSAECRAERARRYHLARYYDKRRDDPAEKAARSLRGRQFWASLTPEEKQAISHKRKASEGRDRINERAREAYHRKMADPDYAAHIAEVRAAWVAKNSEKTRKYARNHGRKKRAVTAARELGAIAQMQEDRDDQ